MMQYRLEQFGNDLGKISDIISFHKGITQLCFPFTDDTSNTYLNIAGIKSSEKEMARETFESRKFTVDLEKC